jgi:glycosyltransferase involved in cell wall biosynthesis
MINSGAAVDVCMITYNHMAFISEAIEGVLKQETNFPVRLIIGEDGSTDTTREICEKYAADYPDQIVLLADEGNLGMIPNFIRTLSFATAKYVALCEGDDYWTDVKKLQTQVDILEHNPDCSICFHRCYELRNLDSISSSTLNIKDVPGTYTIMDLARGNFMHTPSVVYRNKLFASFPAWFPKAPIGDYILHMLNAKHGDIYYIPEHMAVYRIHEGGSWSTKDPVYILKRIELYLRYLITEFDAEVRDVLVARYCEITWRIVKQRQQSFHYGYLLLKMNPVFFLKKLFREVLKRS